MIVTVTIKNMSQSNVGESRVVADPRRWWALAATATTVLVIGLDTTILNVAVPDIAVSLHATGAQLQWFADAYLLALGALLLPAGALGDRYGRKRSTVVGLALGPIVAGVLLQHFWWGSVFVVNLPIIAVALVAVLFFLPESVGSRGRRLDLV